MDPSPGLQRRPAAAAAAALRGEGAEPPRGQRVLHGDIDPPPRARPAVQKLAIAAIVVLGCLQFLPATHFRDPADPQRNWIPFDRSRNPVVWIRYDTIRPLLRFTPPPLLPLSLSLHIALLFCPLIFAMFELREYHFWNGDTPVTLSCSGCYIFMV